MPFLRFSNHLLFPWLIVSSGKNCFNVFTALLDTLYVACILHNKYYHYHMYRGIFMFQIRRVCKMGTWATGTNSAAVRFIGTSGWKQTFTYIHNRRFQQIFLLRCTTSRIHVLFTRKERWESNRGCWSVLAILYIRDCAIDCRSERPSGVFYYFDFSFTYYDSDKKFRNNFCQYTPCLSMPSKLNHWDSKF